MNPTSDKLKAIERIENVKIRFDELLNKFASIQFAYEILFAGQSIELGRILTVL